MPGREMAVCRWPRSKRIQEAEAGGVSIRRCVSAEPLAASNVPTKAGAAAGCASSMFNWAQDTAAASEASLCHVQVGDGPFCPDVRGAHLGTSIRAISNPRAWLPLSAMCTLKHLRIFGNCCDDCEQLLREGSANLWLKTQRQQHGGW